MEKEAKLIAPVRQVTPINKHSASGVSTYDIYRAPTPAFAEQVFCLRLWADKSGRTKVMLRNAAANDIIQIRAGRKTHVDKKPLPVR